MINNDNLLDYFSSEEKPSPTKNQWMMTFADLLSLILTFFVLLYSLTEVDLERWTKITKSLSQSLNPNTISFNTLPSQDLTVTKILRTKSKTLDYLAPILQKSFSDIPGIKDVTHINHIDDRIIISIPYDMIFVPHQRDMTPLGESIFKKISSILLALNNHIDIYGNASNPLLVNETYHSFWELSLARAITVSEYLRKKGYQYKITPYGRKNESFENLADIKNSERAKLLYTVDIVVRGHKAE